MTMIRMIIRCIPAGPHKMGAYIIPAMAMNLPASSSSCPFSISSPPYGFPIPSPFRASHRPTLLLTSLPFKPLKRSNSFLVAFPTPRTRATLDDIDPLLVRQHNPKIEVEESVRVLKNAAKSRKVAAEEVLFALSVIEKASLDPSGFLHTLGGAESPGRTWMLIFTAEKKLKRGRYFPLTAVQRFDAAAKRIENGVYLGPIGQLTFEGRLSWKNRLLSFIFESIRIKVGPLEPLEISLGRKEDREPSTKDPFFIWFYVDEEIAVARGKSGGTAFWCRFRHVNA